MLQYANFRMCHFFEQARRVFFLAFLGRGHRALLIWEFYWCVATNWENSQMKMLLIFYKRCLELHQII